MSPLVACVVIVFGFFLLCALVIWLSCRDDGLLRDLRSLERDLDNLHVRLIRQREMLEQMRQALEAYEKEAK